MADFESPAERQAAMQQTADMMKQIKALRSDIIKIMDTEGVLEGRKKINRNLDLISDMEQTMRGSAVFRVMTTLSPWERAKYLWMKDPLGVALVGVGLIVFTVAFISSIIS